MNLTIYLLLLNQLRMKSIKIVMLSCSFSFYSSCYHCNSVEAEKSNSPDDTVMVTIHLERVTLKQSVFTARISHVGPSTLFKKVINVFLTHFSL